MKFAIATKEDRTIVDEYLTFKAGKEAFLQLSWGKDTSKDLFELTEEGELKDLSKAIRKKLDAFIEANDFEIGEIQSVKVG